MVRNVMETGRGPGEDGDTQVSWTLLEICCDSGDRACADRGRLARRTASRSLHVRSDPERLAL